MEIVRHSLKQLVSDSDSNVMRFHELDRASELAKKGANFVLYLENGKQVPLCASSDSVHFRRSKVSLKKDGIYLYRIQANLDIFESINKTKEDINNMFSSLQ